MANSWIFIITSEMIDAVEERCNISATTVELTASFARWKKAFLCLQSEVYTTYPFSKCSKFKNFRSLFLFGLHSGVALVAKASKLKTHWDILSQETYWVRRYIKAWRQWVRKIKSPDCMIHLCDKAVITFFEPMHF